LGIALFEIIAGEPPFHGESYAALFVQHRDAPVPDLPANAVVPSAVDEIIQKATEKDPGDRFISSGEMASALGELIPESAESNEQWSAGSLPLDPSQSVPLPSRPRLPARSHARSGYAWWGFLPLRAFFVGFLILLVLGGSW
jgi:serine/threonine-protein kinase